VPDTDGLWLRSTRLFPAPRTAVFGALTEPEELVRWWGPHGFTVPAIELDRRVGGALRIAMQPPEGELFHLHGELREYEPPARLAYTFRWVPPDPDDLETVVEIALEERGTGTEVQLTQGEFATEGRLSLHEEGWNDSFDRLEKLLG
jgi:uncharacterized protein YndB with AHSA1/START domain